MTRVLRLVLGAVLAASLRPDASPVAAQGISSRWTPRLELDNDAYNFWKWHTKRPDEEYTNGVFASLDGWHAPRWATPFGRGLADCAMARSGDPCRGQRLTLAQELYTPNLRRTPGLVDDWKRERPFFAWLFVQSSSLVYAPNSQRTLAIAAGVTGPPAMGAVAQSVAHQLGVTDPPQGWNTQIGFEPGVLIEGRQDWRHVLWATHGEAVRVSMLPSLGASLGSIRTHVDAGTRVRLESRDMHPWYPLGTRTPRIGWWLAAGLRGAVTVRDMSLDGTLRAPVRRVDRVPAFAEYTVSGGVQVARLAIGYEAHTRSREYVTGPVQRSYSRLSIAWTPSRR